MRLRRTSKKPCMPMRSASIRRRKFRIAREGIPTLSGEAAGVNTFSLTGRLVVGDVGHEGRVVLRAGRDLDHGDADLGREELLGIGTLVGVEIVTVLHHQ